MKNFDGACIFSLLITTPHSFEEHLSFISVTSALPRDTRHHPFGWCIHRDR